LFDQAPLDAHSKYISHATIVPQLRKHAKSPLSTGLQRRFIRADASGLELDRS